jgi:hypothetical protein
MQLQDDNKKTYISTAATTQVHTGQATLVAIVVGTTAAGTIGIIDNTSGTTVNVGLLASSVVEDTYMFMCSMTKGIRIVTAAASKITVVYRAIS